MTVVFVKFLRNFQLTLKFALSKNEQEASRFVFVTDSQRNHSAAKESWDTVFFRAPFEFVKGDESKLGYVLKTNKRLMQQ